jgi:hypothetical protein
MSSSSEEDDKDYQDQFIKYHNKYVQVAEELDKIKLKYNSLFAEFSKFKEATVDEDMSSYKAIFDFFDAISLFPGRFQFPRNIPFRVIEMLNSDLVREISKEEIKRFNLLKAEVINWKNPGDATNPFLKSIHLLQKNLKEVNFISLMSHGYIGPGDFNAMNLAAKAMGVVFRPGEVTVERIVRQFDRMPQGDITYIANFMVSQYNYSLIERMEGWQDFQLLRKKYEESLKKESKTSDPFTPETIVEKKKLQVKQKKIEIKKTTNDSYCQTEPIKVPDKIETNTTFCQTDPIEVASKVMIENLSSAKSVIDTCSQTDVSSLEPEFVKIKSNTSASEQTYKDARVQTTLVGIEVDEMVEADLSNLIKEHRKLRLQLEMSIGDHIHERDDIEEKNKRIINKMKNDHSKVVYDLEQEHEKKLNESKEENKKLRKENEELRKNNEELTKENKEYEDEQIDLSDKIEEGFKGEINSLKNLVQDYRNKINDKANWIKLQQEGAEESRKFQTEEVASQICSFYIRKGFKSRTRDDSDQWSSAVYLEELFKAMSENYSYVYTQPYITRQFELQSEIESLRERVGNLVDRNDDLKNKLLALELDGSQRGKTLFENALNVFEDKLFRNALSNICVINELSERLKTDYIATNGMYDRMEAARRQLQSDLAKSQNVISSLAEKKTSAAKISAKSELREENNNKNLFREIPKITGYETSDEMQMLKNMIRDNMEHNEALQIRMKPANASFSQWLSKFYQFKNIVK